MSSTDVVTPSNWAKELSKMRQSESKVADITQKEQALAELGNLPVWKNIKTYFQARIRELRDEMGGDIRKETYELIGQKTTVFRVIEDEFEGFINLVENTRKVVEEKEKDVK